MKRRVKRRNPENLLKDKEPPSYCCRPNRPCTSSVTQQMIILFINSNISSDYQESPAPSRVYETKNAIPWPHPFWRDRDSSKLLLAMYVAGCDQSRKGKRLDFCKASPVGSSACSSEERYWAPTTKMTTTTVFTVCYRSATGWSIGCRVCRIDHWLSELLSRLLCKRTLARELYVVPFTNTKSIYPCRRREAGGIESKKNVKNGSPGLDGDMYRRGRNRSRK